MTGQDQLLGECSESVKGGEGGGAVCGESAADGSGSVVTGNAVVGNQGAASEDGVVPGENVSGAARGVSGHGQSLRAAGEDVEGVVPIEGAGIWERWRSEASEACHVQGSGEGGGRRKR